MTRSQGTATSVRTPVSGATADKPAAAADSTLSAGRRDAPTVADYRFILRGSKGPIPAPEPAQLYARACEQGWPGTCGI